MSGNIEDWAPIHYTCQRALNKYKLTWANFRPTLRPNQNKLWARFSSSPSGFRLVRMKSVSVFIIWANTTFRTIAYLPTYSMEQSPSWEANWFAASQEIHRILWNPKVHYRIHKCPLHAPIFSQLDPVHTSTSHFLKFRLILFSHLRLGLSSGFFPPGFPTKTLYTPLPSPILATCPAHLILLDFITHTFRTVYINL